MQTASRHLNKGRHSTVDPIPKAQPLGFQVIKSLAEKRRIGGQHRGRFAHHPVALFEAMDEPACFRNVTGKLMPQNNGIIHRPTLLAGVLMQVAAADADSLYFE